MRPRLVSSAAALGVALVLLTAVPGAAEPVAWDAGQVTGLAKQLSQASAKLYTAFYESPEMDSMPAGFGAGDDSQQFQDNVRILHSEALHFVAELEKGKGQGRTKPIFQRLHEISDDLKEYANRVMMQHSASGSFASVENILDQLAPYYRK